MKLKILFIAFLILLAVPAYAGTKSLPYKELADGGKISVNESGNWTFKVSKKKPFYKKTDTLLVYSDSDTVFDTGCNFLFTDKGRLIGYSQKDLKLYEISVTEGNIEKTELAPEEVSLLFKDYKMVGLSEFSQNTNVYIFEYKKPARIMLFNDKGETFGNYVFSTGNSRIDTYPINSMVKIKKKGMVQFTPSEGDAKNSPWYIILAR